MQRLDCESSVSRNAAEGSVARTRAESLWFIEVGICSILLIAVAEIGPVEQIEELGKYEHSCSLINVETLRGPQVHLNEGLAGQCIGLDRGATLCLDRGRESAALTYPVDYMPAVSVDVGLRSSKLVRANSLGANCCCGVIARPLPP